MARLLRLAFPFLVAVCQAVRLGDEDGMQKKDINTVPTPKAPPTKEQKNDALPGDSKEEWVTATKTSPQGKLEPGDTFFHTNTYEALADPKEQKKDIKTVPTPTAPPTKAPRTKDNVLPGDLKEIMEEGWEKPKQKGPNGKPEPVGTFFSRNPFGALADEDFALREDKLALKIFNELVRGDKCGSLGALVKAYASSTIAWKSEDCPETRTPAEVEKAKGTPEGIANCNPEAKFGEDGGWETTFPKWNQINEANRKTLKMEADGADCHKLLLLVGSPFRKGMLRTMSPYEFVFKLDDGWDKTRAENVGGEGTKGIAVQVVNTIKCSGEPCDKNQLEKNAKPMFKFHKGRGKKRTSKGCGSSGGIRQPEQISEAKDEVSSNLKNFWAEEGLGAQVAWSSNPKDDTVENCKEIMELWCKDAEQTDEEINTCEIFTRAAAEGINLCGPQSQICGGKYVWAPANASAKKGDGTIVAEFDKCNVPWVGGVSGSLMEQLAFAYSAGVPFNDEFLVVMLAGLALDTFHSMGEGWAAAYPFLEELAKQDDEVKQQINAMAIMKIKPPMTLDGCTDERANEESFLEALEELVNSM